MAESFPGLGHRYLVNFVAFQVELLFTSLTSLTYTAIHRDGTRGGESETMAIAVLPIRNQLYLVRWQESDRTTVVHLEDYKLNRIVTNITGPNLTFSQYDGTMRLIA